MEPIIESDMQFGPYSDEEVFWIEKSRLYTEKLQQSSVKCCEFILNRGKNIYFIEAKKSCPNQLTANSTEEKKDKYNKYIEDITEKMRHAISTYASLLLNRHQTGEELPPNLAKNDLSKMTIKLVLVVKTAEASWLIPLMDVLNQKLRKDSCIWRDVQLYAINEAKARELHLVI